MRAYTSLIAANMKLALREPVAVFFNYVFPLVFFFIAGQILGAGQGGIVNQVVTMVLVVGILGNGLFGGGIRAVQDREQNILRRFKVAPITPVPILTASIVTGWALYLPAVLITLALARAVYGMALPDRWLSLFVLVSVGVIAFRAVGLIIAAVANSTQESQILVQLVYLPMLFLTGATLPIPLLPEWAQTLAQFLPGTHLVTAIQGIMVRRETVFENWQPVLVLLITAVVSIFLAAQLFRWERGERIRTSAKLWLAAVVVPSLLLGGYHAYSREQVTKTRELYRDMMRSRNLLIRGARVFTADDGRVLESGSVFIRAGRIVIVYDGVPPETASLNAEVIEGAGKTVLPGLIDVRVNLTEAGGPHAPPSAPVPLPAARRALAGYLYSGIIAVRAIGAPDELVQRLRQSVSSGELLGAELFTCGPETEETGCMSGSVVDRIRAFSKFGPPGSGYVPSLAALDGLKHLFTRDPALINRPLVQQVNRPSLINGVRLFVERTAMQAPKDWPEWVKLGDDCLLRAHAAGIPLATGTDAGTPMVFHGPTVQHELKLWVRAGVPPSVALEGATANSARLLRAGDRIGMVREGYEASLLVVDGNPLEDISVLERISDVIYKGERIDRSEVIAHP